MGAGEGASPGWQAQRRPWGHRVASVVLSPRGALELGWRPPQKHGRRPVPPRGWGSNSGFTFGYEFNFKGLWVGAPWWLSLLSVRFVIFARVMASWVGGWRPASISVQAPC